MKQPPILGELAYKSFRSRDGIRDQNRGGAVNGVRSTYTQASMPRTHSVDAEYPAHRLFSCYGRIR